jgi:putative ABC transport system permease protein
LGLLAAVTLLLAIVGLSGVMADSVAQQARELGVRMALGADGGRIVAMVLGRSIGLATVGAVLGMAGALVVNRSLAGLLYRVRPTDPVTLGVVALALGAAALIGAAIPARRAARLDPLTVLKES